MNGRSDALPSREETPPRPKVKHGKYYSYIPLAIMLLIVVVFVIVTGGTMLNRLNMLTLVQESAALLIAASGMLFIISQGSIDLSAGGVAGVAGLLACLAANNVSFVLLFPVAILVGGLIGFINGFVVAKLKVSSFLTTLSMLMILRALMNLMLYEESVIASDQVKALMKLEYLVPVILVVCAVMYYLFERTRAGYYVRAIGENEVAARYAGMPVGKYKILGFTIGGMLAGLAGVLIVSRVGNATNATGTMFELQTMIAIFLGGVLVAGGRTAKYYKVLLGTFTYMFLENGLSVMGISSSTNQAARGALLIVIVAITGYFYARQNQRAGNKIERAL